MSDKENIKKSEQKGNKKSIEERLCAVKCTWTFRQSSDGKEENVILSLPHSEFGLMIVQRYSMSDIRREPVLFIKKNETIARYTSAHGDADVLEFIKKTPLPELKKILENG